MEEQPEVPEIPHIEEEKEEVTEKTSSTQRIDKQIAKKIKETVNVEIFLPEIFEWIHEKLKDGPTLIIGEKIGVLAEEVASRNINVVARDSSASYVSPKTEVKDKEVLSKMDIKPFSLDKLKEIDGIFLNIIVIFALKKLPKKQQLELLEKCKRILSREGQLIVVGEFYPKSALLLPISLAKEGIKSFNKAVLKRKVSRPLTNFDKITKQLELKFFDVKYDAGGRIRTYVLTKRWGALVT